MFIRDEVADFTSLHKGCRYIPKDTQTFLEFCDVWYAPKAAIPPKVKPAARDGMLPTSNTMILVKNIFTAKGMQGLIAFYMCSSLYGLYDSFTVL